MHGGQKEDGGQDKRKSDSLLTLSSQGYRADEFQESAASTVLVYLPLSVLDK